MTRKTSPEAPGAIRARLAYLHSRKAALDELIHCMERYELYLSSTRKPSNRARLIKSVRVSSVRERPLRRLAGAA
jgi:hypothetical protein